MFVINAVSADARVVREGSALAAAGHDVTVLGMRDPGQPAREHMEGFRIERLRPDPIARGTGGGPARRQPGPVRMAWGLGDYWMRALVRGGSGRYEVYHAHDLVTLPVAWLAARLRGRRVVYDAHELFTEIARLSRVARAVFAFLERRLIARSDRVITVNDSIADELARRYGVPRPVVVRNCPRTVGPAPRREASPLRGRAGVPAEAPILLYQGMFMPYRGLENLVRSVRGITRAHLVLLGWGPLRDSLSALARAEGVAHRVRFLEGVPLADLLAWTAGADVGAIPTRHVGLNNYFTTPNKLFEYCAAGVPVVASRFPELSRYVDGLGLGRTFDPESPLDIAAAVNALLDDPGALARARANVARAAAGLTWEAESRVLLEIYAGLGTSAPPGREGTAEAAGGDRRPAS